MKKEEIIHYLNPNNWNLSERQYEIFSEIAGDCTSRGISFVRYINEHGEDEEKALFEEIGSAEIVKEMQVRFLLDGYVECEMFM